MICSYIPPCREHSAWQMLGLFLCVTLNVSEWHLTDDTLLVEQVLVARTIFREQRSKNGSVISRSDFSLSQDLSPLLSLLTNSHGNEKAKGCFPNPQQKSHGIWDTEHRPSPEREIYMSEELPDPSITGCSFFTGNISTAAVSVCTAPGLQWWGAGEHTSMGWATLCISGHPLWAIS